MADPVTVYVSSRCTNCQRFVGALRRTDVGASARILDVDVSGPVRGLEYVPTVREPSGRLFAGTQAFEWLKQFEASVELDSAFGGGGGLPFSMVDDATGLASYAEAYSAFTPPV
jgi:hypothetical protein